MDRISSTQTTEHAGLRSAVSLKDAVEIDAIFLFEDATSFIEEILKEYSAPNCRLFAPGPCQAEIVMASDRAEIEIVEVKAEEIAATVSETDIIFLANPNRSTGSDFSLAELKRLSAGVPRGLLLVDEYYFDFLKISAAPALKEVNNIIVIRYFNNWVGTSTKDHGYALSCSDLSKDFNSQFYKSSMSRNSARICYEQFGRSLQRNNQLREIQTRCLKLAREITDIGLNCRLTAADFLIVEVDSAETAEELQNQNQLNVKTIYNQNKLTSLLRCQVTLTEADNELLERLRHVAKAKNRISKHKVRADQSIKNSKAVHMN